MTLQTAQLQDLIRQIDEALRKSTPRFPWLQSAESVQQRQVLQQTRSYLLELQYQAREAEERPLTSPTTAKPTDASAETAQQVLQSVLQEMNYLRANMLQPLRSDIDALQHQRQALVQEIQQLESKRQMALPGGSYPPNQQFVAELLQSSMQQLQQNLTGQVAQMMAGLSASQNGTALSSSDQPLLGAAESLDPMQRLQHMQQLQSQSDQLMLRLDAAIRIIFESMQTNLKSYEDSLEQGLNRMHTLGQQGEAMFSTLVSRLAEHLGRETSTYLQSSLQSDTPTSGFLQGSAPSGAEIDQLLGELNALERSPSEPPDVDLEQLDLPTDFSLVDLSQTDFAQTDFPQTDFYPDEDVTFFQVDPLEDEDVTMVQDDTAWLSPSAPTSPVELESAMDLLSQLGGDPEPEPLPEAEDEFYQSLFGEAAEVGAIDAVDYPELEIAPALEIIPEPEVTEPEVTEPEVTDQTDSTDLNVQPEASHGAAPDNEEISDLGDLLFSGMGDPAIATPAEPSLPPEFLNSDRAQSVESFLLQPPEPPVDTIHSLTDLLDAEPSPIAPAQGEPEQIEQLDKDGFDENSYEPADPEEDLLLRSEPQQALLDPESLSENTRQLLESDLSGLEFADEQSYEGSPVPDLPDIQADMTLFNEPDLFDQPDEIAPSFPMAAENAAEGLSLEGFDFTDQAPATQGLSLDNFDLFAAESGLEAPPEQPFAPAPTDDIPPMAEPQEQTLSQASSQTQPQPTSSTNAFSFEGLEDDLFEPMDETAEEESRSLEPEELLKKKRFRAKGGTGRGFGR